MRRVAQITPSQGSEARSTRARQYTPNTNGGRGNASRLARHTNGASSPLLSLSRSFRSDSDSDSPAFNNSSTSPNNSSKPSSPPHPSTQNPLPHTESSVTFKETSPLQSSAPPSFPRTPFPKAFVSKSTSPTSPTSSLVLSNPNASLLSNYSGAPLSSESSQGSVQEMPLATNGHPSSVIARPRTSSRIPYQGAGPLSSLSLSPPFRTSPQKTPSLDQIKEVDIESWQGDPPSPINTPSPHPSPSFTHTLEPQSRPPSSSISSLTPDPFLYANVHNPSNTTFSVTPHLSLNLTASASPRKPGRFPLSDLPSPVYTTRPTIEPIYATPVDAIPLADRSPIYENVTPLTVSPMQSPIYETVLPDFPVTTTTPDPSKSGHNSSSSSDSADSPVPVSYI